jgi:hypothetical protein
MVRPERIELEPFAGVSEAGARRRNPECNEGSGGQKQTLQADGAPGENRTPNLMVRSHALYPIELRAHLEEFRLWIIKETTRFSQFDTDKGR